MRLNPTLARANVAALFVVLLLTSPIAAQAAGSGSRNEAVNLSPIHIDNFGRVNANYYRGAQPEGRDYEDLAALGIKTVINLTSDDADPNEQALVERAGMVYVQIPMTTRTPPTPAQLAQFATVVNDSADQPVYVHCVGGRHRTGVMTAAYRMTHDRWTADQAFTEMKTFKYGADFLHPEFKQFVYAFQAASATPTIVATANVGG